MKVYEVTYTHKTIKYMYEDEEVWGSEHEKITYVTSSTSISTNAVIEAVKDLHKYWSGKITDYKVKELGNVDLCINFERLSR
jgi:hypothetical protein